jgi:hypothetical protein
MVVVVLVMIMIARIVLLFIAFINRVPPGCRIWIVLHGMLQVTRTAVKFASAQEQLVQRVVRRKGSSFVE